MIFFPLTFILFIVNIATPLEILILFTISELGDLSWVSISCANSVLIRPLYLHKTGYTAA